MTEGRYVRGTAFITNDSRPKRRAEGDSNVKKLILLLAIVMFAGVAGAGPDTPPGKSLRLVMQRRSNVPQVDIMKNLSEKCPNVTITTNPERSDYMLYAIWTPDDRYRFEIIAKGGDSLYATKTILLSNAVKDVCHFLNTRP
jgi:hypothetical protein